MKRLVIRPVIFLLLLSAASSAFAQKFPTSEGYVTDTTGTLDAASKQRIVEMVRTLHEKTTAQLAVVVIDTMGGMDVKEYTVKLFEKWGIGSKEKDNGVLFLVVVKDRKVRIETGYGMEGALNDAKCGDILRTYVTPNFKAGRMSEGIVAGSTAILKVMAGEYQLKLEDLGATGTIPTPAASTTAQTSSGDDNPLWGFIAFFGVAALVIFMAVVGKKKGWVSSTASSDSSDSGSSWSSSDSSSDSFDGGSSGGGGADSDW